MQCRKTRFVRILLGRKVGIRLSDCSRESIRLIILAPKGVTYESGSGDYAEWLERIDPEEEMKYGDIVGVFGSKITNNTKGADQVMVISWKPIVLGNMPEPGEEDLVKSQENANKKQWANLSGVNN